MHWKENFFIKKNFSWRKIFHEEKFFMKKSFSWRKICHEEKFFMKKSFSWRKIFQEEKFFMKKNFSWSKIFHEKIFHEAMALERKLQFNLNQTFMIFFVSDSSIYWYFGRALPLAWLSYRIKFGFDLIFMLGKMPEIWGSDSSCLLFWLFLLAAFTLLTSRNGALSNAKSTLSCLEVTDFLLKSTM